LTSGSVYFDVEEFDGLEEPDGLIELPVLLDPAPVVEADGFATHLSLPVLTASHAAIVA
jgi:hypothetical protein